MHDPAYAIEDNTGAWRAQPTWPTPSSYTSAALADGQYVDDGIASTPAAPAAQEWDMEHYTDPAPPAANSPAPPALTSRHRVDCPAARPSGRQARSTKRTRLLVAADPGTMSGKAKKAHQYGIPIVHPTADRTMLDEMPVATRV